MKNSSNAKNNFYVKPQIKYHNADADKINIFADNRNKIGGGFKVE